MAKVGIQDTHCMNKVDSIPRHLQGKGCKHWVGKTSFGVSVFGRL